MGLAGLAGAWLPLPARADLDAGLRAYRAQDWSRAAQELAPAAAAGNSQAQYYLGVLYSDGHGVPLDNPRAFELFMASARQNDRDGQNAVGFCLYSGECAKADAAAAVDWFRKSAAQGNPKAHRALGVMSLNGHGGLRPDKAEAALHYRRAAEAGDVASFEPVGRSYYYGWDGAENFDKAVQWYRRAADAGVAAGAFRMGVCYRVGKGVERNVNAAVDWLTRAATQGDSDAMLELGDLYMRNEAGRGKERLAYDWVEKAATAGNASAQTRIGQWTKAGMGGRYSQADAKAWFLKAAENGDGTGQYELAMMYQRENNFERAEYWLRRAADQGALFAARSLSELPKIRSEYEAKVAAELKEQAEEEAWWAAQSPARRARRSEIEAALENTFTPDDFRFSCARNARNLQINDGPAGSLFASTRERDTAMMYARDFERCMNAYEPPSLQSIRPVWPLLLPEEQANLAKAYRSAYGALIEDSRSAAEHIQRALTSAEDNYAQARQTAAAEAASDRQWRDTLRSVASQIRAVGERMKPPPAIDRVAFAAAIAELPAEKPAGDTAGKSGGSGSAAAASGGTGASGAGSGRAGQGSSGRSASGSAKQAETGSRGGAERPRETDTPKAVENKPQPKAPETRDVVVGGRTETCHARDHAIDLAFTNAKNNANRECNALAGYRYQREKFKGYEQCSACGSSGEFRCVVTQAVHTCVERR